MTAAKTKAKRPSTMDWLDVPEPQIRLDHFEEDRLKLHPDLRPYLRKSPLGSAVLQHPLTYQVFGVLWKMANDQYDYKVKALAEAHERHDWYKALMLHERPWRVPTLIDWMDQGRIPHEDLRKVLPHVWTDTENPRQYPRRDLIRLFEYAGFVHDAPSPDVLDKYGEPERGLRPAGEVLAQLPRLITVYRGTGTGEASGLAWSTDPGVASWFARRFREDNPAHRLTRVPGVGRPLLLKGTVKRDAILGWFTGRGESEIVVNPRRVTNQHPIDLQPLKVRPPETQE